MVMMKYLAVSSLLLLSSLFIHAESSDEVDYFDLSLKELLDVKIYTANQEVESTAATPATTSVITAKQLRQWGVNNLYEALSFLPGIVLNETYMGYSTLTFRGVTPGLYNNKALFMINGQPAHEALFGSSHLEYVPLEMVERIEVVRSPASALYGTNAISGVVNVITKQQGNQANIKLGSNQHIYAAVVHHTDDLSISASTLRDDGYSYDGTDDELGNPVNFDYEQAQDNIFIDYHPEGWRINLAYFETTKAKFGLNPINQHHGDNRFDTLQVSINRYQPLGAGTLNLWLRYDSMDKELDAESFPPLGNPITVVNKVERSSAEIQYKYPFADTTNIIIGASFEMDKSDPMLFTDNTDGSTNPLSPFTDSEESHNSAVYAQVKHAFTPELTTVIGLRAENNKHADSSGIIPRLGISYQFSPDHYFKVLYSEAFRTPVFLEKYANVPNILSGDLELEREKIQTFEMGVNSRINQTNTLAITVFQLDLSNEITRRPASPSGTEYYNAPGREMYGIETEWKSMLTNKLSLDFNLSYVDGEEDIFNDAPFIANYSMNIMLNYELTPSIDISVSNQTISAKDYILTNNETGEVDAYNLTNLVLNYHQEKYEVALILRNIFDEEYTYPEPVRRNISEIPGGAGATAYLNLTLHY
jgi:iron complex outermembrane receptor protein